jgi:hypothetical protein
MKFEIENNQKENLKAINMVLNLIFSCDVTTLDGVQNILETLMNEPKAAMPETFKNYIWGRGGNHIWLSQKNDGKRIMIFY